MWMCAPVRQRRSKTYCPTHTVSELSHSDSGCCEGLQQGGGESTAMKRRGKISLMSNDCVVKKSITIVKKTTYKITVVTLLCKTQNESKITG